MDNIDDNAELIVRQRYKRHFVTRTLNDIEKGIASKECASELVGVAVECGQGFVTSADEALMMHDRKPCSETGLTLGMMGHEVLDYAEKLIKISNALGASAQFTLQDIQFIYQSVVRIIAAYGKTKETIRRIDDLFNGYICRVNENESERSGTDVTPQVKAMDATIPERAVA